MTDAARPGHPRRPEHRQITTRATGKRHGDNQGRGQRWAARLDPARPALRHIAGRQQSFLIGHAARDWPEDSQRKVVGCRRSADSYPCHDSARATARWQPAFGRSLDMVTLANASVATGARMRGGGPLPPCPNSPRGNDAERPCRSRGRARACAWSPRFRQAACRAGSQAGSPAAVLAGPGETAATMVEYGRPLFAVTSRHDVAVSASQAAEP